MTRHDTRGLPVPRPDPCLELDIPKYQLLENALSTTQNVRWRTKYKI